MRKYVKCSENDVTFEQIESVLDDLSIGYEIEGDYGIVEFWTDTAGQDVPTEFNFDGTPEGFIREFVACAESYDVDEEFELYASMLGKNGIPSSARILLEDLEEAKSTLMEIANALESLL